METERRCHRPSRNTRNLSTFELTYPNRAQRAELSSGKKNTTAVGARKTQRVYSAPPLPRGSGKFSCPATQRRETSWGGTNSSLHRRDTSARQRAVHGPQGREEGVASTEPVCLVSLWCSPRFFHHEHIFIIFGM